MKVRHSVLTKHQKKSPSSSGKGYYQNMSADGNCPYCSSELRISYNTLVDTDPEYFHEEIDQEKGITIKKPNIWSLNEKIACPECGKTYVEAFHKIIDNNSKELSHINRDIHKNNKCPYCNNRLIKD